jgi:hypothetical protein
VAADPAAPPPEMGGGGRGGGVVCCGGSSVKMEGVLDGLRKKKKIWERKTGSVGSSSNGHKIWVWRDVKTPGYHLDNSKK